MDLTRAGMPAVRRGPKAGKLVMGSSFCIIEKHQQWSSGGTAYNVPACQITELPATWVGTKEMPVQTPWNIGAKLPLPLFEALKKIRTMSTVGHHGEVLIEAAEKEAVPVKLMNTMLRMSLIMGIEDTNAVLINPDFLPLLDAGYTTPTHPGIKPEVGPRGGIVDGD